MVAKDTIIGVVGAVILVAALTGVFYYEGSSAQGTGGANDYDLTWTTSTTDGPGVEGETEEGATTSETLTVQASNMTKAEFVLSWTDDTGSADTFNVTVTSPSGQTKSASGDSGEITVTFEGINDVPPQGTISADSKEEARSEAAEQYTATRGQGDWTVEIACENAGDANPVGAGPAVEEDTGNTWELSSELTVYAAQIK